MNSNFLRDYRMAQIVYFILVEFSKPFVLVAKFMSVKSFIFPYYIFTSCRTYSDIPCFIPDVGNLYFLLKKNLYQSC